jgi:hypothetical protein
MQTRYVVSLLLILSAGAYLLASDHVKVDDAAAHENARVPQAGTHAYAAMTDMLHHADLHLAHATPHPHSLGTAHGWVDGWELHWMDFHSDGHLVRLYHATHVHHPHVRFVAIVHSEHHHSGEWHRVH